MTNCAVCGNLTRSRTGICSRPGLCGRQQAVRRYGSLRAVLTTDATALSENNGGSARCKYVLPTLEAWGMWRAELPAAPDLGPDPSPHDVHQALRKIQGELCALCLSGNGRGVWPSTPVTDHDHSDGLVRGVLCRTCNLMEGQLQIGFYSAEVFDAYRTWPPAQGAGWRWRSALGCDLLT